MKNEFDKKRMPTDRASAPANQPVSKLERDHLAAYRSKPVQAMTLTPSGSITRSTHSKLDQLREARIKQIDTRLGRTKDKLQPSANFDRGNGR